MPLVQLDRRYQQGFNVLRRKPLIPVMVDWTNPITRGMKRCVLTGLTHQNRDLVTGITPTISGTHSYQNSDLFFQSEFDGYAEYGSIPGSASASVRTLFAYASSDRVSANSAYSAVSLADNSAAFDYVSLEIQAGTRFQYSFRDNGSQWITAGNPEPFKKYAVCGVSRSATSHSLYVDGAELGASTASSTPDGLDTFTIGAIRDSSPLYGDGSTSIAMYFDRALTAAEVKSLSSDPYQVLKPYSPLSYMVEAGGGGEITATSSFTLDGLTIDSSSVLDIIASLNSTLSGASLSSVTSNLVSTDSAFTLSSFTLESTANVIDGISANAEFTLDNCTIESSCTVVVDGQSLFTLGDITLSSNGDVLIECDSSFTLDSNTIASDASVISGRSSSADFTLDDSTLSSTVSNPVSGALESALDNVSLESATANPISSDAGVTLNDNTISSEVIITSGPTGNASFSLDNCAIASTGSIDIDAISNFILDNISILSDVDVEGEIVVGDLQILYTVSHDTITYTIGSNSVTWVKV